MRLQEQASHENLNFKESGQNRLTFSFFFFCSTRETVLNALGPYLGLCKKGYRKGEHTGPKPIPIEEEAPPLTQKRCLMV